jgi:hypothetical protein
LVLPLAWVHDNGLDFYNDHDRAALIHLGEDPQKAREILSATDSRSYQLIWGRVANISKTDESNSNIHKLF